MISKGMAKLIGCLPKGLVSYLSKKIVNGYIDKYADIHVEGIENIKDIKRPILFVCNHLSNSDGVILNKILKEENVTFVAGIKLSKNPFTNMGTYVVKTITIKPNTADKDAISSIVKTLKGGNNVLIFPEGTRSRTGKMIEAKKGVVLIQKLTKARIVPIGIWGSEKLLPINEKDMGNEKFNYAKVNVRFGEELLIKAREKEEEKHHYEERILNSIMASIAALIPEEYRGVYSDLDNLNI